MFSFIWWSPFFPNFFLFLLSCRGIIIFSTVPHQLYIPWHLPALPTVSSWKVRILYSFSYWGFKLIFVRNTIWTTQERWGPTPASHQLGHPSGPSFFAYHPQKASSYDCDPQSQPGDGYSFFAHNTPEASRDDCDPCYPQLQPGDKHERRIWSFLPPAGICRG
jgi:hypothetical protein